MLFVDLHLNTSPLILICKSCNSCFKMFLWGGRFEIFKGFGHQKQRCLRGGPAGQLTGAPTL